MRFLITLASLLGIFTSIISGQTPSYVFIGCFYDSNHRTLPTMVDNLRDAIDWNYLKKTIDSCASRVQAQGYEYFGLQFYGECWSGKESVSSFANKGPAPIRKCPFGVGTAWVNAVYKLVNLPPCSTDLKYKPKLTSGSLHETIWCSNKTGAQLEMTFNSPTRVTGIGVQGSYPDKWVTSFTLDYSEGEMYVPYRERGLIRTFQGNTNWYDLHIQWLVNPSEGLSFRVTPKTWTPSPGPACARFRLFGCKV